MSAGFRSQLSLGFQSQLSMLSGDNPLDDTPLEDAYLKEALRRGGNEVDLMQLQWKLQVRKDSRELWRPATGARLLDTADILSVDPDLVRDANKFSRDRCIREHRAAMEAEFSDLGELQKDFDFKNADKTPGDPVWLYSTIRAAMYRAGYDNPLESIFKKIKKNIPMLNKTVGGGLHEKFIEPLSHLESKLNSYAPGLSDKTAKQFKSVYGFVPRNIAQSTSLSNHAFGLAIDIDATWNPMIKDRAVIDALRQITDYDFGAPFFPQDVCSLPKDRIQQIHKQQQDASDRLRTWLQRFLPAYEARSKKKPSKNAEPLEVDWNLNASEDVGENQKKLLDALVGAHGADQVRAWANHGIQNIPLELAVALVDLGFGWGSEYKHKKDVMHFELEYRKTIELDVRTPRTLEALLSKLNSLPGSAASNAATHKRAPGRKAHQQ
jgi:hypothetical protein